VFDDATHVRIKIPIIWKGAANSLEKQAAFSRGIEQRWSGTWGGISVKTQVTDGTKVDKHLANTVYIKRGEGNSKVYGGREGHWYEKDAGGWSRESTGAHEAGHFLGRKDAYKGSERIQGNPVPQEGYDPCNVMVNPDGTPDTGDIHKILQGDGSGYRGDAPKAQSSASAEGSTGNTRRSFDAYGSTTETAARWEESYGYGGWFTIEKNYGR
jgi:hypothetical protein